MLSSLPLLQSLFFSLSIIYGQFNIILNPSCLSLHTHWFCPCWYSPPLLSFNGTSNSFDQTIKPLLENSVPQPHPHWRSLPQLRLLLVHNLLRYMCAVGWQCKYELECSSVQFPLWSACILITIPVWQWKHWPQLKQRLEIESARRCSMAPCSYSPQFSPVLFFCLSHHLFLPLLLSSASCIPSFFPAVASFPLSIRPTISFNLSVSLSLSPYTCLSLPIPSYRRALVCALSIKIGNVSKRHRGGES